MAEMKLKSAVRREICTFALGLSFALSMVQSAEAQLGQLLAPGQNLAQQKMGQSLSNLCPKLPMPTTPGQQGLQNLCMGLAGGMFGLTQPQMNAALEQLNGGAELLVPVSQPSLLETAQPSQQTGVVEARLSRQREWILASAAADGEFLPTGQVAALTPQDPGGVIHLAQNQAPEITYSTGPFGVFASGLGQFGSRDLTTSENGYSFNNAGFVAGADYRLTPRMVAGLAFGYTRTNTSFDTSAVSLPGQFLHDNSFTGNVYTTVAFTDALYMNVIALVGGGDNNSQRRIVIPNNNPTNGLQSVDQTATGSFGTQSQGVTVSSGYTVPFGSLVVTPIVRFFYQHTGVDGFSENAPSVNLRYNSSSINTVLSSLGADAQYTMSTAFGLLYPMARAHWTHQYSPGNTSVPLAYVNDATP
ncbi:MAG: autotransporter outer membrane beta-barrel domain-containing protein, partial [Stellaceae bacterium]